MIIVISKWKITIYTGSKVTFRTRLKGVVLYLRGLILSTSLRFKDYYFFDGVLRTHISTSYDYTFITFLNLFDMQNATKTAFAVTNALFAALLLAIYLFVIY